MKVARASKVPEEEEKEEEEEEEEEEANWTERQFPLLSFPLFFRATARSGSPFTIARWSNCEVNLQYISRESFSKC